MGMGMVMAMAISTNVVTNNTMYCAMAMATDMRTTMTVVRDMYVGVCHDYCVYSGSC